MTSEAPFLHCRLCGARYRSDEVVEHEKQCANQNSNTKDFSGTSSIDSGINELRDKKNYYMKEKKTTKSAEDRLKDLTTNEESIDSSLNLENSGLMKNKTRESRKDHEESTGSRSKTKTAKKKSESKNQSSGSQVEISTDTTYDEENDCEVTTETKTVYASDGRVIKTESKKTYHDPKTHEIRKDPQTRKNSNEDKLDPDLTPIKEKSPLNRKSNSSEKTSDHESKTIPKTPQNSIEDQLRPDLTSTRGKRPQNYKSSREEMSAHHQKSHLNEKAHSKLKQAQTDTAKASTQKSDEEQKKEMISAPYPSEEDIKIPTDVKDSVAEAADVLEHLPELSEQNEMAYEQHKKALVPCTHCERTFRPDRLAIHEKACIERPKTREYIVPEDKKDKKQK